MAFSYMGHQRYLHMHGALTNGITEMMFNNVEDMRSRGESAAQRYQEQMQPAPPRSEQPIEVQEPTPAPKRAPKERNEQAAAYKRAETNAQKAHDARIRKKNETLIANAMRDSGVADFQRKAAKTVPKTQQEFPKDSLKGYARNNMSS